MSSLTSLEKRQFTNILGLQTGYVLGDTFNNQTFQDLVRQVTQLDISSPKYETHGTSKGKRLCSFWEQESDTVVAALLSELMGHWAYNNPAPRETNSENLYQTCITTIARLRGSHSKDTQTETDFMRTTFGTVSFDKLPIENTTIPILQSRYEEVEKCLRADAPLAAILLIGSILEGILLGMATKNPCNYSSAPSSPKNKGGKTKPFHEWSLSELIDVSSSLTYLSLDIKKFSHVLRDFRNYIHPYQQLDSQFSPNKHTAEICLQVLKAAVADITKGSNCR